MDAQRRLDSLIGRASGLMLVSSLLFLVITLATQFPLGVLLAAPSSIGAWIWLGGAIGRAGGSRGDAAKVGALTGLIGPAVSGLVFTMQNDLSTDAGFGLIGFAIVLVVWPIVGAIVCDAARPQVQMPVIGQARVTTREYLYDEPKTASRDFDRVSAGEAVELLEQREEFSRIRARDGREGWIRTSALAVPSSGDAPS
jgi:hypothetical protein